MAQKHYDGAGILSVCAHVTSSMAQVLVPLAPCTGLAAKDAQLVGLEVCALFVTGCAVRAL